MTGSTLTHHPYIHLHPQSLDWAPQPRFSTWKAPSAAGTCVSWTYVGVRCWQVVRGLSWYQMSPLTTCTSTSQCRSMMCTLLPRMAPPTVSQQCYSGAGEPSPRPAGYSVGPGRQWPSPLKISSANSCLPSRAEITYWTAHPWSKAYLGSEVTFPHFSTQKRRGPLLPRREAKPSYGILEVPVTNCGTGEAAWDSAAGIWDQLF